MCAYGRVPGTEREVVVLVVVDEPRGSINTLGRRWSRGRFDPRGGS
jgi:hypothetical protein